MRLGFYLPITAGGGGGRGGHAVSPLLSPAAGDDSGGVGVRKVWGCVEKRRVKN